MRAESTTKFDTTPPIEGAPWDLIKIKPLPGYKLEVNFTDGSSGLVEMSQLIMSSKAGVFAALKNIDVFNQVFISDGAATWPGEIDICPDTMHEEIHQSGMWILK